MDFPAPIAMVETNGVMLSVVIADITTLPVDAIVNAANTSLLGGGGVDGAIHRVAGQALYEECKLLGGCEPGSAKITLGYRLPARHVIHAVGPVWQGGSKREEDLLADCYAAALDIARSHQLGSVAFPAISTGVYRFPPDRAARIAIGTVVSEISAQPESLTAVVFCCFSQHAADLHYAALNELGLV
jgi:O-acetyl-ADP-ribose deacetylase (regulator of RNase III)